MPPEKVAAELADSGIVIAMFLDGDEDARLVCKGFALLQEIILTGEARGLKHTVIPRRDREIAEAFAAAFNDKPLPIH